MLLHDFGIAVDLAWRGELWIELGGMCKWWWLLADEQTEDAEHCDFVVEKLHALCWSAPVCVYFNVLEPWIVLLGSLISLTHSLVRLIQGLNSLHIDRLVGSTCSINKQFGAGEARRAHNPEVLRSKRRTAKS